MSRYVFLGPTLPAAEAAGLLNAVYLPPVRQGDLLRLVREQRPSVVGIVDGYFRDVPACWHKEILFALANGVHVFGAASMGALRAAELDAFGMVGIGSIYTAYRLGRFEPYQREPFEDDDEVAIVHGPAETGFVNLSEAMVNIRATLARAAEAGVIDEAGRDRLAAAFKAVHYPDRTLSALLAAACEAHLNEAARDRLAAWLPTGRADVKASDARAMLAAIAALGREPPPFAPDFRLEETAAWRTALADAVRASGQGLSQRHVLDEVRLGPATDLLRRAVERRAALLRADEVGFIPDQAARRRALAAMRKSRGLLRQRDVEDWCRACDLDENGLSRLAGDEARLDALKHREAEDATEQQLDLLRLEGGYGALKARAEQKEQALAGLAEPVLDERSVAKLVSWHAMLHHERVPDDFDGYARALGFADAVDLSRALWREEKWRERGSPEE
jgi:hypothetical protein